MTFKEFDEKWNNENFSICNEYIEDCFDMYETEGFADTFESIDTEFKKFNGKPFRVIRRCNEVDGFDLEVLPVWLVELEDGTQIQAFPDEICSIERK